MGGVEAARAPEQAEPSRRFGTFLGVFTPSLLTILGVMMYLRFGWVLGNLGLPLTLLAVLAASGITLITGMSASAIATNMRVGVGGEYFLISRSLGPELGGAIGIPLFLCRTLSLTLYAFGLAESVGFLWPTEWGEPPVQLIAGTTIIVITAVAGRSAELTLKLQIPVMFAVGLSLVALVVGVLGGDLHSPEMTSHTERSAPGGFWYVFAVFFPAVTGFTAGIGMSGDLKDPRRSIPRGTILAVLSGLAIYLGIMFLLATTSKVSGEDLARLDPNAPPIWTSIAFLGFWLVYPGMWGAILSSAFGSALGGPRVLQALAQDGLAPRALARTSATGQPTIATWVTGGIALAAVALGGLNAVGQWVTMFFLTLYVTINLAAALESIVGDPSYRPTIKLPWWVSLCGSLGAVGVMFLINPVVCLVAVFLELLLYLFLRSRAMRTSWGDVRAGLCHSVARFALLQLRKLQQEARHWRPNILLFTRNSASRMGLVRLANWFNQDRGVVTICQVVVGDLETDPVDIDAERDKINAALEDEGLTAFSQVDVVPELESGLVCITQANGFAGMQANTIMFGWPGDAEGLARLLRVMRAVSRINVSTVLARLPDWEGPTEHDRIEVWWRGIEQNGDLMMLLAYLLSLNPEWSQAKIVARSIVDSEEEREPMTERIREMLTEARIKAATDVVVRSPDQPVPQAIHEAGRKADIAFLGLRLPEPGEELEYAKRLQTMASGFHTAVFVRNASTFAGEML